MNNYKNRRIKNSSRSETGFTLIEVLVASAILVILATGFLGLQYIIGQNQVSVWRNYLSIEASNSAVSIMIREIRDVRESDTGTYPLETTNDQEIIFYSDYDYDDLVERVRYTLSGSILTKGIIEPTGSPAIYPPANERVRIVSDIIRNGTDPVFYYYNSDWPGDTVNNPLAPAERISHTKLVKVILRANPETNDPTRDYILETVTRIRSLTVE